MEFSLVKVSFLSIERVGVDQKLHEYTDICNYRDFSLLESTNKKDRINNFCLEQLNSHYPSKKWLPIRDVCYRLTEIHEYQTTGTSKSK